MSGFESVMSRSSESTDASRSSLANSLGPLRGARRPVDRGAAVVAPGRQGAGRLQAQPLPVRARSAGAASAAVAWRRSTSVSAATGPSCCSMTADSSLAMRDSSWRATSVSAATFLRSDQAWLVR